LWVDPATDKPAKLQVSIPGTQPTVLEMNFTDFMPVAPKSLDMTNPRIPKVITYEANGKLFRRTTITDFQAEAPARSFPMARWRQQLNIPDVAPAYVLGKEGPRP